ncbi:MAG TPA: DUF3570 domain-containing protein [Polyangiaceae bacterium]|nr:DUF3570 domain-containing protein [Polyangiaceae bacterium]
MTALFCAVALGVRADAASGTVTGSVSLRGNYYLEKSTRVIAPAVTAALETPQGIRFDATYLLDAITSASLATGAADDVLFTEKRHDFTAGAGYEVDFGGTQLDLAASGRMSREPDYKSRGFGFAPALSLNERNTVLRLNGYYIHDDVARVVRMAPTGDPDKLVATTAMPVGTLDTLSLGFAIDQLLSPLAWATLGYDLAIQNGFTANAYRTASFPDGGVAAESHPRERHRHAVYGWLQHYIPVIRGSLRAGYRLYKDDWDILAHAVEARAYQELGPYVEVRLRYRYYTQNASFFWNNTKAEYMEDGYVTADPKMTAFHDHTFGFKLRVALGFLQGTWLNGLHNAVFDGTLEYIVNTNRYGNGWVSQGGFIWPF